MDTTKKIHDVSAALFFLLAFGYLFAALAFRNGYYPSLMIFGMRLLDIPFAALSLLYGGTGLHLQINEAKEDADSVWGILIFALCLVLFGIVVFMNLAFPSRL
jgi:uncharacterized RDD family membrane protein YckC